jgi:hypothetical protein
MKVLHTFIDGEISARPALSIVKTAKDRRAFWRERGGRELADPLGSTWALARIMAWLRAA